MAKDEACLAAILDDEHHQHGVTQTIQLSK